MSLRSEDVEKVQRELELIRFYRKHPVIAAEDLLCVDLSFPQQAILEDMWFKNYVMVVAGRGTGKSFIDAVFACLWGLLWPGEKVGLLAPSFRQSKVIFAEVDKIWNMAPLFQEATNGRPVRASDRCYLNFKSSGSKPPSVIEAVPLGDGNKIRGSRYYVIIADEFAQLPVEVFNTVVMPMGATVADPMQNVKKLAMQDELIRTGKATKDDFEEQRDNKIIMTSSAFYRFNHMYETLQQYKNLIAAGDQKYAVHEISYRQIPKGFLSEDNLSAARNRLSKIQFSMEYEANWEADSAGVFKASLIEECKKGSDFTVKLKGDPSKRYVLGVDPAKASDAFALCMIELDRPHKVVGAWEVYQANFPAMADFIVSLCDNYNVTAVLMDAGAGGGGLAMKDNLAEERKYNSRRLLDVNDETTLGLNGRRVLHLFNPSPRTNAEAVYAALNLMEQRLLSFPRLPLMAVTDEQTMSELDQKEELHETVEKMIQQLLLIEVTENKSGVAHFDVPSGGGHSKQKKDLYTSFILASKQAYDLTMVVDEQPVMLEMGLVENLKLPAKATGANRLSKDMHVSQVPVSSWAFRKTFKPTDK
jgi:hypothetical protein